MHLTPEKAEHVLSDVMPEHHFRLHMGADIRNLRELAESLDIMTEDTFKHHVTGHKNDFAKWVHDIVDDKELALELQHLGKKEEMIRQLRRRISYLDKRASFGRPLYADEWMHFGVKDFIAGAIVGFIVGIVVRYVVMLVLL